MNVLWAILCFAGTAPLALIYRNYYRTLLAPAVLFAFVWLLALGMYNLEFVRYIDVDANTWAMFAASGGCFLLGCLLGHMARSESPVDSQPSAPGGVEERRILATLAVSLPLGFLGFAMYVGIVNRMVGYDAFIRDPVVIRNLQDTDAFRQAFRWPRFLNYLNILNVTIGAYYISRYRQRRWRNTLLVAMGICFLTTLASMDRTLPFAALAWAFFTAGAASEEGHSTTRLLTRLGAMALVVVALFVGVGAFLGKTIDNNPDADKQVLVSPEFRPFVMPYIYLTASIPAYQEFVRHTEGGATHGMYLLLPAAKLLQSTIAPYAQVPDEVGDYYSVPFAFNTHTWLDVCWSDFGYVGILGVPLLVGFGATRLFLRTRSRPTFRGCTMYGLSSYIIANSIFVNKIVSTPVWEYFVLLMLISSGLKTADTSP